MYNTDFTYRNSNKLLEKNYDADLLARGISAEKIRHYGFAFKGKEVLIGSDQFL